jgi:hypothetical protein
MQGHIGEDNQVQLQCGRVVSHEMESALLLTESNLVPYPNSRFVDNSSIT